MRVALFDNEGNCIGIYSGAQDLSVLDYADAAEVGPHEKPNECKFNKSSKKVEHKEHIIPPRPPRTEPSFSERLAALEDELKKLKK